MILLQVCPCASSSEALTVSIRRPGRAGVNATGRGVLSMSGLSYGVVRVDTENSLTSLTLQDCGQVMPGSKLLTKAHSDLFLCSSFLLITLQRFVFVINCSVFFCF